MAKSGRFEHRECKKCKKHKNYIFMKEPDGHYCRECHRFIEEEKRERAPVLKRYDDPVEESESLDSDNDPGCSGQLRKTTKKKAPSPDNLDADGNDNDRSNEVPMKLLRMASKKKKCSNQACAVELIANHTRRHPITREQVCRPCYCYFKMCGKERSEEIVRRLEKKKQLDKETAYMSGSNQACAVDLIPNYTIPHPITREPVCILCYRYFRKHGKERSEEMVRRFEKRNQFYNEVAYKRYESGVELNELEEKRCSNQACAVDLTSNHSVRHPIKGRLCRACYQYFRKFGKERSGETVRLFEKKKKLNEEVAAARSNDVKMNTTASNEAKAKETRCSNQACAVDIIPKHSNHHPITKKRVCRPCYNYFTKHGNERSEEIVRKFKESKLLAKEIAHKSCSNQACAVDLNPYYYVRHPITRKRVCRACHQYFKRNGKERPKEVVRRFKELKPLDKEIPYKTCSNQACAVDLIPQYTIPHPITKERVCRLCYKYFKMHGKERSEEVVRRFKESKRFDKKVAYKRSNQDETPILQNTVEDLRPTVVNNEMDQPSPMKKITSRPPTDIFEESDSDDEDPMIFYKDFEDSDESGLSREESEEEESSSEDDLEYLRPFRPPKNSRDDDEDEYLPNFMQQSLL